MDRLGDVSVAGTGVDVVMIATPDRAIAEVASKITPGPAVVLHCSGATGLAPVSGHGRHGSIHPLMALPSPETGAVRLAAAGWFAVAGDPLATELVGVLGGRSFSVADGKRALYHATAVISANHLVALLGQVERLASLVGVPVQAFLDMAQDSLDDVAAHGATRALTGPASRGDHATLAAHREALPPSEVALYDSLVEAAQQLASGHLGSDLSCTPADRVATEGTT